MIFLSTLFALLLTLSHAAQLEPIVAQVSLTTAASLGTLLNQAQAAYHQRSDAAKAKESVSLWESALALQPNNYESLWKLSRAYYWMGNHASEQEKLDLFTKGKEYGEAAVKANPEGIDGHYWLGVCLGRYGEEKGVFKSLSLVKPIRNEMEAILKLDPNHAGAHHVLGVMYRKAPGKPISIGSSRKSLAHAQKAVELDPTSLKYIVGLAEAEIVRGKKEDAKKHLEEVLRMPPNTEYIPESLEDKETAQKLLNDLK